MGNNNFTMKDYKVKNIIIDLDKITNGENTISLLTSINVMINEKDTSKIKAQITCTFKNTNSNDIIFKIVNEGFFENFSEDIQNKEVKEMITEQLYKKTRMIIDSILKSSNIDFLNIPPYEDIQN